ncbi:MULTISPECIES: two-component system regulatory protein YycI [Cytobacillus]|uniref:Two-component system regulatory protein YycI n=1 Tax=Cytobacillus stercorigallinarum TaxID=2762240 RepID=A0ABR8QW22_9BACI|nr:two-component system regulatory protein YycI [Cytobacillus stercorigallinarum]MBD7939735.1 two-component system regulatory protein YycI [Cytobacillus stercorigallinarum]
MDWSKIKTIFILTFLVLNVYLLYEYFNVVQAKEQETEFPLSSTLEEKLKDDNISYDADIFTTEEVSGQLLRATPKEFEKDELKSLNGEDIKVDGGVEYIFDVNKPLMKVSEDFDPKELESFIQSQVLYGNEYRFWEKKGNTITYYQTYQEKIIYQNKNAELTFFLNENNEIVSYTQTYLEAIEPIEDDQKLIKPPSEALSSLYNSGKIPPGSKVSEPELGLHTYVDMSNLQVLTPAWRFVIDGEYSLYVHGFELNVLELNKNENKTME